MSRQTLYCRASGAGLLSGACGVVGAAAFFLWTPTIGRSAALDGPDFSHCQIADEEQCLFKTWYAAILSHYRTWDEVTGVQGAQIKPQEKSSIVEVWGPGGQAEERYSFGKEKGPLLQVNVLGPNGHWGEMFTFYGNGRPNERLFVQNKKPTGWAVKFHDNGRPQSMQQFSELGLLVGPEKRWNREGELVYEKFRTVPEPMRFYTFNPPRDAAMDDSDREAYSQCQVESGRLRRPYDVLRRQLGAKEADQGSGSSPEAGPLVVVQGEDRATSASYRFFFDTTPSGSHELEALTEYQNGVKNGWHFQYYPSGPLRSASRYSRGRLDGANLELYEDGMPRSLRVYKNGQPSGTPKQWSKDGKRETLEDLKREPGG